MSSIRFFIACLALAAALADTVITSDTQVQASFSVKASSDARNYFVLNIPFANNIIAFGYTASSSNNNGNGNTNSDATYVTSSAGIGYVGISWAHFTSTASFDQGKGTVSGDSSSVFANFHPLGVVYYTDNNGNGKYDAGEEYDYDSIIGGFGFTTTSTKVTAGSGNSQTSVWTNSHNSTLFGFRWTVSNRDITNQGVGVDANTCKIDIWITPTASKAKSGGRIALIATYSAVHADAALRGNVKDNGNVTVSGSGNVQFSRNGAGAALSWAGSASTAFSNGPSSSTKVVTDVLQVGANASITVNGRTVADGKVGMSPRFLVFSFADAENPSQIYWDPTFGAQASAAATYALSFLAVALAALLF